METKKQQRAGLTKITSISVSNEFNEIIKKYNISPTEIFRRGMGVTLFEMGIERYNTVTNRFRSEKAMEILKQIEKDGEFKQKLENIKKAILNLEVQFNEL